MHATTAVHTPRIDHGRCRFSWDDIVPVGGDLEAQLAPAPGSFPQVPSAQNSVG